MKLKSAAPAAAPAPAEPISEPADDAGFGDFGGDDTSAPEPTSSDDKPFKDEPFDAGVEADEETDPKKFIEQLTGKLGQSLRKYNEEQGQPDFELEKFVINSVLSATHTAEMDEDDKKDIIKKVNTSGNDEGNNDDNSSNDNGTDDGSNEFGDDDNGGDMGSDDNGGEEDLEETVYENFFLDRPKKNNMFQEGSNDILDEMKPCWKGYKQVGMKEKDGREVPNCVPVNENHEAMEGGESMNYMFWQNLKTIHHASGELLEMNHEQIDEMCANGHAWAVDHVSSSADDIEEVYHFFEGKAEDNSIENIKLSDELNINEKNSIFDKNYLKMKIQETFNHDDIAEPMVEPQVKPEVKPTPDKVQPVGPKKKNEPFLPLIEVKPDPKAKK